MLGLRSLQGEPVRWFARVYLGLSNHLTYRAGSEVIETEAQPVTVRRLRPKERVPPNQCEECLGTVHTTHSCRCYRPSPILTTPTLILKRPYLVPSQNTAVWIPRTHFRTEIRDPFFWPEPSYSPPLQPLWSAAQTCLLNSSDMSQPLSSTNSTT